MTDQPTNSNGADDLLIRVEFKTIEYGPDFKYLEEASANESESVTHFTCTEAELQLLKAAGRQPSKEKNSQ